MEFDDPDAFPRPDRIEVQILDDGTFRMAVRGPQGLDFVVVRQSDRLPELLDDLHLFLKEFSDWAREEWDSDRSSVS